MKYYRHPNIGYYNDYFGVVSVPVAIGCITYIVMRCRGYRVIKAPSNYTIEQVHILAQINAGSHPSSFRVDELRKKYKLGGFLKPKSKGYTRRKIITV